MAFTPTKVTGVGTGASTYFGTWDLAFTGGTTTGTLTINGGANTPDLNFANLLPQSGGGTVSTVVTNATVAQALKVTVVPTSAAGAIFWDAPSVSNVLTNAGLALVFGSGTNGTARVYIERNDTFGF